MGYENILLNKEDKISIITINRPESLNALNAKTISELSSALNELDSDQSCRVLFLREAVKNLSLLEQTLKNSVILDRKRQKNLPETDTILYSIKLKI